MQLTLYNIIKLDFYPSNQWTIGDSEQKKTSQNPPSPYPFEKHATTIESFQK